MLHTTRALELDGQSFSLNKRSADSRIVRRHARAVLRQINTE